MKKVMMVAAAAAALIAPGGAQAETVCVGDYEAGACANVQPGCIVGGIKNQQYFAPCVTVRRYLPGE